MYIAFGTLVKRSDISFKKKRAQRIFLEKILVFLEIVILPLMRDYVFV